MNNFKQLLEQAAKKLHLDRTFRAITICETATKILNAHFNEQSINPDQFKIISYKNHQLKIRVNNSATANLLYRQSQTLIKKFQSNQLPEVKTIKITHTTPIPKPE